MRDGTPGWQPSDGTPLWSKIIAGGTFNWLAIDGCGRHIAFTGDSDSDLLMEVYLFNRSGTLVWSWEFTKFGYVRVDMPWDGRSVVAVNDDPTNMAGTDLVYFSDITDWVLGWQATDGVPLWFFTPLPVNPADDFYSVAISPDGKVIATGPGPSNVYLLSNAGGTLQTLADGIVNALDLTFTGEYGVVGDRVEPALSGTVYFFSKTRNTILWSFATQGKINSVAIQKKYPCLEPFPYHDVDVSNVIRYTTSDGKAKHYVCQGYNANAITVTLSNRGNYPETVEITLYAYSSSNNTLRVCGNTTVIIQPRTAPVVSIDWLSTSVPYYGNYTLCATIGPVQDENNLVDNEFIDSGLVVTGVGDINGDRKCDLKDVLAVALVYGSSTGQPKYHPDLDIVCDYKIDLKDYMVTALNYGKNYT
jgi:hypothetical protein